MASFIEKIVSPTFYRSQLNGLVTSAGEYYKPLFRSGSATPLWHMMLATSLIMYTANYVSLKGAKVQAQRQEKKLALEEYYEKHGHSGHH